MDNGDYIFTFIFIFIYIFTFICIRWELQKKQGSLEEHNNDLLRKYEALKQHHSTLQQQCTLLQSKQLEYLLLKSHLFTSLMTSSVPILSKLRKEFDTLSEEDAVYTKMRASDLENQLQQCVEQFCISTCSKCQEYLILSISFYKCLIHSNRNINTRINMANDAIRQKEDAIQASAQVQRGGNFPDDVVAATSSLLQRCIKEERVKKDYLLELYNQFSSLLSTPQSGSSNNDNNNSRSNINTNNSNKKKKNSINRHPEGRQLQWNNYISLHHQNGV